jgi:hypothetical protein
VPKGVNIFFDDLVKKARGMECRNEMGFLVPCRLEDAAKALLEERGLEGVNVVISRTFRTAYAVSRRAVKAEPGEGAVYMAAAAMAAAALVKSWYEKEAPTRLLPRLGRGSGVGLLASTYPSRFEMAVSAVEYAREELAEAVLGRMIAEYMIDNAGLCRFHRRWAEPLLQHLYRELLGLDVDPRSHALETLRAIARYQLQAGAGPRPWESRKTIDMVAGIAVELGDRDWGPRMASDPAAAREWWERFREKLWSLLGLEEPEQEVR